MQIKKRLEGVKINGMLLKNIINTNCRSDSHSRVATLTRDNFFGPAKMLNLLNISKKENNVNNWCDLKY